MHNSILIHVLASMACMAVLSYTLYNLPKRWNEERTVYINCFNILDSLVSALVLAYLAVINLYFDDRTLTELYYWFYYLIFSILCRLVDKDERQGWIYLGKVLKNFVTKEN